jgi:hypothetical protein
MEEVFVMTSAEAGGRLKIATVWNGVVARGMTNPYQDIQGERLSQVVVC